jgi:non-ribosomal peptide synthetase component F
VPASETIALDGIAWGDIAWTRPVAVPLDRNGPVDRRFTPCSADFTERAILDLLRQAAAPDPNAVAIVGAAARLTYAELIDRIGRIARYVAAAVPAGGAVATLLPNSPQGFAAMLGCLAAARVCIVLDVSHPRERNGAILQDANPTAVLLPDDSIAASDLGIPDHTLRLSLRAALNEADQAGWVPASTLDPDEPALVHYTSGSSGRPKGTVISTRAALRRAQLHIDGLHMTGADRVLSTSQPSTNSGFCYNLGALCSGARLLVHALAVEGAGALFTLAQDEGLTLLHAGRSIVRTLFAMDGAKTTFARLRVLRSGGDVILWADIANWRNVLPSDCHIAHSYASTEAMFGAHWFVPTNDAGGEARLPAGYPLADQDYALIDEAGHAVPAGEPGEFVLRSRHIACGEWRDGRCVPGRIRTDPSQPGWRMLRTGDLLRLGADGVLRFVSRVDRQIKINGVRIEPAEVESVLRGTPGVTDTVVVPRQRGAETNLVAYVAADVGLHRVLHGLLRERLRVELPTAMRPARIIMLKRMPYLSGGKIDVRLLPDIGESHEPLLHRLIASWRGSRRLPTGRARR